MEQLTKLFADVASIAKSLEIIAANSAPVTVGSVVTPAATGEVKVDKAPRTTGKGKTTPPADEKPKTTAPTMTRDKMKAKVLEVKDATSKETAQRIFQPLGYDTISAIDEKHFQQVFDTAVKVLARLKVYQDAGETADEDVLFSDEEIVLGGKAEEGDDL